MDRADLLYGDLPAVQAPGVRFELRRTGLPGIVLAVVAVALIAATVVLGMQADRHEVTSSTVDDAYPVDAVIVDRFEESPRENPYLAVRFTDQEGTVRYGRVHYPEGEDLPGGEQLRIWVDPDMPWSLSPTPPDAGQDAARYVRAACLAGVAAAVAGLRAAFLIRRTLQLRLALRGTRWRSSFVRLVPVRIGNGWTVLAAVEVDGETRRVLVPGAGPDASGYPPYERVPVELAASTRRTLVFRREADVRCWVATVPRSGRTARVQASAFDAALRQNEPIPT